MLKTIQDEHKFYDKGRNNIKHSRVGFLVNNQLSKNIIESDKAASLTLSLNKNYNFEII